MIRRSYIFALLLSLLLACSQTPTAFSGSYDEAINGDLSGNHLSPTAFQGVIGDTIIKASTIKDDIDYFTINVPEGAVLSEMILTEYISTDPIAFAGIVKGRSFVEPFSDIDSARQLLGWVHLGAEHLGEDFLDDMAAEPSSKGFAPPLLSGDYSIWIQQTGLNNTDYTLRIVITAAP